MSMAFEGLGAQPAPRLQSLQCQDSRAHLQSLKRLQSMRFQEGRAHLQLKTLAELDWDPPTAFLANNTHLESHSIDLGYLNLLWYPMGILMGIGVTILLFGLIDLGNPFQPSVWWHCAVPCGTLWLGIDLARSLANFYFLGV